MQEVLEASRPSLGQAHSPQGISDSSRRASLRTALPSRNTDSGRASSARTRLSRKRAASLELETANHQRLDDLTLDSAGSGPPLTADPTRDQVCLCQPDPKIPRPRNAFILYRQHYQASVVAQHPGLANPEISKIIGEQWRAQSPETKDNWKRLAEEEKTRHQRQYPGYRYQPRRSAKSTGSRPTPNSDDPSHCPKCNGRYISTPNTPSTPFTPGFDPAAVRSVTQPPFTPLRANHTERLSYSASMQNLRMESPRGGLQHPPMLRRPPYSGHQHLPTHHEVDDDVEMVSPDGSDFKRRRFNQETYRYNNDGSRSYASSPGPFLATQPFARNGGPPMSSAGYRQHLPPTPGMLARPRSMAMGPPQHHPSANHQTRHQYTPQSATFDESLRLPPLQTQLPLASSAASAKPDHRSETKQSQAKSVEAMVMTIPFVNKVKVLAKISPALAAPSASSPAIETRGAAIAIEGSDKELHAEVGRYIKDNLENDTSCVMKTWSGPTPATNATSVASADTTMTDGGSKDSPDLFTEYLTTISDWHKKSQEMIKHITTPPTPPSTNSKDTVQPKLTPIALIPTGFSLTTSDAYAIQIPINDSYAPVDHWQWMATLWRGIIGPDLTIYAARVGRDEVGNGAGVEVRKDCSAIVVRVEEGKKMDEKTARRLGFEVLEFVRGEHGGIGRG